MGIHHVPAAQENLAFAAGLKVSVDTMRSWPAHSDAVYAEVDATRLDAGKEVTQWADTAIVASLVECMRASAGQYAQQVRWLMVRIKGPERFARYGGAFELKAYACGPLRRQFDSN